MPFSALIDRKAIFDRSRPESSRTSGGKIQRPLQPPGRLGQMGLRLHQPFAESIFARSSELLELLQSLPVSRRLPLGKFDAMLGVLGRLFRKALQFGRVASSSHLERSFRSRRKSQMRSAMSPNVPSPMKSTNTPIQRLAMCRHAEICSGDSQPQSMMKLSPHS